MVLKTASKMVPKTDGWQDTTLWIHILFQMLTFGVLFPLGMVLGVSLCVPTPSGASLGEIWY